MELNKTNTPSSITELVKEAEREKYIAEAAKALAERDKLLIEIEDAREEKEKLFFQKKWFIKMLTTLFLAGGILGFYITYVIIPMANSQTLKLQDEKERQDRYYEKKIDSLTAYAIQITNKSYALNSEKETIRELIDSNKEIDKSRLESLISQQNTSNLNYYCVVSSYPSIPSLQAVQDDRDRLQTMFVDIKSNIKLSIYKTVLKNQYAITMGDKLSHEDALIYRQIAVSSGIAKDAYTPSDAGWEKIE